MSFFCLNPFFESLSVKIRHTLFHLDCLGNFKQNVGVYQSLWPYPTRVPARLSLWPFLPIEFGHNCYETVADPFKREEREPRKVESTDLRKFEIRAVKTGINFSHS